MSDLRNITPEEYTDKDMQVVTQLAYIDFEYLLEQYKKDNADECPTIGELIDNNYDKIFNQYMKKFELTTDDIPKDENGNDKEFEVKSAKDQAANNAKPGSPQRTISLLPASPSLRTARPSGWATIPARCPSCRFWLRS